MQSGNGKADLRDPSSAVGHYVRMQDQIKYGITVFLTDVLGAYRRIVPGPVKQDPDLLIAGKPIAVQSFLCNVL